MVMDYEQRNAKYKDIISNLNEELNDLVSRCKEEITEQNNSDNPILSSSMPSCGSMYKNEEIPDEDLTAEEMEALQETAEEEIADILDELTAENIDEEISNMAKQVQTQSAGAGSGDLEGYIYLPKYTIPPWFDEIEAAVGSLIGTPSKGRKGTDYEEMQTYIEQGIMIVRRPKVMIIEEDKEVYVLLDQSGSMTGQAFNGVSYLKLLGGFIPLLGEEYSGRYWMCDYCSMSKYNLKEPIPNKQVALEDVTEKLIISGGGGTSFDGAFRKLGDIERKKQEENPDYEMCLIFFSDMYINDNEFDNYRKYGPSKTIFVSAKNREGFLKKQKWIYNSDKHKVVLIDLENSKKDNE
jgi:hypothetical protein